MRVFSVNCGLPREVEWRGRIVTTGIYKQPVVGRVALRKLNLEGDGQADLTVHGGEAYLKDVPKAEMHRLDSGHFAVEDCLEQIATNIHRFYDEQVSRSQSKKDSQ